MRPTTLALTAILFANIALRAEPELKGTSTELTQYLSGVPRLVNLMGYGEIRVPADRASISVKVVTENKSLQEALRVNQELRAKMARVLAEKGVPAERIQAAKFSSTPKYGMFGEKARSYRVENTVKMTAQDEKEFQAVGGLVDTTPEFRYDSIEFEHSEKDGFKLKALAQALDKAAERKRIYEEKLGVKLTPRSFSEGAYVAQTQVARRDYPRFTDSFDASEAPARAPKANGLAVAEDLSTSFGELVFKAQVTVEYSVESK